MWLCMEQQALLSVYRLCCMAFQELAMHVHVQQSVQAWTANWISVKFFNLSFRQVTSQPCIALEWRLVLILTHYLCLKVCLSTTALLQSLTALTDPLKYIVYLLHNSFFFLYGNTYFLLVSLFYTHTKEKPSYFDLISNLFESRLIQCLPSLRDRF